MNFETYFISFGWFANIITGFTVLLFLISFFRLKEKSSSQYMILILTISDFGYPLKSMLDYYFVKDLPTSYLSSCFGSYIYRWSLYWSVAIGLFTYKLLTVSYAFNPKRFIIKSICWCTILSTAAPIM